MISQESAFAMLRACDAARVALNRMLEVELGLACKTRQPLKLNTPFVIALRAQIASLTTVTTAARKDMVQ